MVSHSIVIRGGDHKSSTQEIRGGQALHCRYAVLTSVIVQMRKKFREGDETDTTADTGHNMYGVSIRFPVSICPPGATHHSGADDEHKVQNRIDVHFSQDGRSLIYKPQLILHDMTFQYGYPVTLYHIDDPNRQLTMNDMSKIHSITLNFSLTVDHMLK